VEWESIIIEREKIGHGLMEIVGSGFSRVLMDIQLKTFLEKISYLGLIILNLK